MTGGTNTLDSGIVRERKTRKEEKKSCNFKGCNVGEIHVLLIICLRCGGGGGGGIAGGAEVVLIWCVLVPPHPPTLSLSLFLSSPPSLHYAPSSHPQYTSIPPSPPSLPSQTHSFS